MITSTYTPTNNLRSLSMTTGWATCYHTARLFNLTKHDPLEAAQCCLTLPVAHQHFDLLHAGHQSACVSDVC